MIEEKTPSYIELLTRAREMEDEAIAIGLLLIKNAPPEDIDTLTEIAQDETDHDGLYSSILLRELTKGK